MKKKTNRRSVYHVLCKNNIQIEFFGFFKNLYNQKYIKGMQYFPHINLTV